MLTLDYVAGFFDGEGSIGIRRGRNHKGQYRLYDLRTTLSNTHLPIMEELCGQFGGNLRARKDWHKYGKKPQWEWALWNEQAGEFLRLIRPHLSIKEAEAWLALEFLAQRTLRQGKGMPVDGRHFPPMDEEFALRDGFYWALRNAKNLFNGEIPSYDLS